MAHQQLNKFIGFIFCILLASCQMEPGFEENTSLGESGWPEKQTISFSVPEIKENGIYELETFIRQDNNYPFYNCYFIAELKTDKGITLKKGLAEAIFYDPKTGKPKGQGLGDLFNHRYKIFNQIALKKGDKIQVQFRQFMRRDTLSGIVSVGFALKPTNQDGKN